MGRVELARDDAHFDRGAERLVEDPARVRPGDRVLDPDQVAGAGEHELEGPVRVGLDVVAVEAQRVHLRPGSRPRPR